MVTARAPCAPGLQVLELPLNLVLLVLEQLPVSCQAKLVNKAAYSILKHSTSVSASCPSLPLWVLQQTFQLVNSSSSSTDLGSKLISSRAAAGDLSGVQWLHQQGVPWTATTAAAAAGAGQLHMLQFLQAQDCCMDVSAANAAARTGQLSVLRWMWERSLQGEGQQGEPSVFAESCCQIAASSGQLEVLQFLLLEAGCRWPHWSRYVTAAAAGQLHVLQWLRSLDTSVQWGPAVCAAAAAGGHTHVLAWLRDQGCPWDDEATFEAAGSGHIATLQWLRRSSRLLHGTPQCALQQRLAATSKY